jgi:hypothetical protein
MTSAIVSKALADKEDDDLLTMADLSVKLLTQSLPVQRSTIARVLSKYQTPFSWERRIIPSPVYGFREVKVFKKKDIVELFVNREERIRTMFWKNVQKKK